MNPMEMLFEEITYTRDDEIEWEMFEDDADDDATETDGDEIETVSLDEWLAEIA